MKGYDGVFIMNYILSNLTPHDKTPNVINCGSKLLLISFNNVKIIDSFSFIPIGLAEFPKAFGIKELKKGFFPHLFNTAENQNYIGEYPAKEYFGYKFFSSKKIKEFDEWYQVASRGVYDFQKEFLEYCWSDVLLLMEGCLSFRQIIQDMTIKDGKGIDPFRSSITIASMCHVIFRRNMLKSNQLAYIPECVKEKTSSFKALKWLSLLPGNIKHAMNGGEHKIGQYFVDGYDQHYKIIYEFDGCYFHGCPRCYRAETFNQVRQLTMGTIFNKHIERIQFLRANCNLLIEIWECDFDKLNIQTSIDMVEPLNPRDSLFGGRTNAIKLYHKVADGQRIYYSDFTSLYPYVQKTGKYPIGHPVKITNDFGPIENYFGIVKCKVSPPKRVIFTCFDC